MIGIYKITNRVNNHCYIGQSVNIKRRFMEHKILSGNRKDAPSLKLAIKKYGIINFDFCILETIPSIDYERLNDLEQSYVKKFRPEYNRTLGGQGCHGRRLTPEMKEHLRQCAKKQWQAKTEDERKAIIRKNLVGPRIGHTVSKETREKLRKINLGKTRDKRKVIIVETNQIFNSVNDCAKYFGKCHSAICHDIRTKALLNRKYHVEFVV